MAVERSVESYFETFDRVLDKGIVIDALVRVAVVGIELITVKAHVVVASIQTYLQNSEALALVASDSVPTDGVTATGNGGLTRKLVQRAVQGNGRTADNGNIA